jgi:hypothetical protein
MEAVSWNCLGVFGKPRRDDGPAQTRLEIQPSMSEQRCCYDKPLGSITEKKLSVFLVIVSVWDEEAGLDTSSEGTQSVENTNHLQYMFRSQRIDMFEGALKLINAYSRKNGPTVAREPRRQLFGLLRYDPWD